MIFSHLQHKHLYVLCFHIHKPVFRNARLLVEIIFHQPVVGHTTRRNHLYCQIWGSGDVFFLQAIQMFRQKNQDIRLRNLLSRKDYV